MRATSKPFAKVKLFERHKRRRGRLNPSSSQIATLRLRDLAHLFRARHGITLPDNEIGRETMLIAVNHLASLREPLRRIDNWLGLWCPWITLVERNKIAAKVMIHQQRWTADQLAWRLKLTMAERTALAITTIGAIDCSKAQRRKLRKLKAKQRVKQWRQNRTQHKTI